MTPSYESHNGCRDDRNKQLDEIIHVLHKINRKLERLFDLDFAKEDAAVVAMTKKLKEAKSRVPTHNKEGK